MILNQIPHFFQKQTKNRNIIFIIIIITLCLRPIIKNKKTRRYAVTVHLSRVLTESHMYMAAGVWTPHREEKTTLKYRHLQPKRWVKKNTETINSDEGRGEACSMHRKHAVCSQSLSNHNAPPPASGQETEREKLYLNLKQTSALICRWWRWGWGCSGCSRWSDF